MTQVVHHLIAKTAREIAAEAYEAMAHDNNFYKANPSVERFVRRKWKHFIVYARSALATMLGPEYEGRIADGMREQIYEALLIDGSFKTPPKSRITLH